MDSSSEKSSADIQRDIDDDRKRIEARIGAIQERMSPGQLVDEVLAYAKGSGGGEYVSNLGKALKDNPLPVALMSVSLAWLIAKQGTTTTAKAASTYDDDYPLYSAQGAIRRVGSPEEIGGARYSHFADDAGHSGFLAFWRTVWHAAFARFNALPWLSGNPAERALFEPCPILSDMD